MINTDSNCQGRAQGTALDTFAEQRNAMQLQELLDTVDGFFQDYGLADNIETINVMLLSMLEDEEPMRWTEKFILDCNFRMGNIVLLLAKMYELRRTHLYTRAI